MLRSSQLWPRGRQSSSIQSTSTASRTWSGDTRDTSERRSRQLSRKRQLADADPLRIDALTPLEVDQRLRERVTEAVIAQGGFRHEKLNAFLRERLSSRDIRAGALFSEPV